LVQHAAVCWPSGGGIGPGGEVQSVRVGRPARAARRARALWGIEGTSGARFLLLRAAKQPAYLVSGFLIADSINGVVRVSSSPRPGPEGRWRARDSDVDV